MLCINSKRAPQLCAFFLNRIDLRLKKCHSIIKQLQVCTTRTYTEKRYNKVRVSNEQNILNSESMTPNKKGAPKVVTADTQVPTQEWG